MPPVREPSTKPSAATVLPAPVACSNQKRLPALGSSGASGSCSSSRRRRPSSSQSCGSSGSSSSVHVLLPGDRRPRRAARRPARRRRRSVGRCRSPRLGQQRGQRAGERVDLVGGEHACRRRAWAPPGRAAGRGPSSSDQRWRQATDGTFAPASSSASAASSARRRALPGASCDRGVLALEHERLAGERRGAGDRVVVRDGRRGLDGHWRGFGHTARCEYRWREPRLRLLRGSADSRAEIRGLVCGGTGGREVGTASASIEAERADATSIRRSATVWGVKRAAPWIARRRAPDRGAGHRARPGGRGPAGSPPPSAPPFDLDAALRELEGAAARWPRCTTSRRSSSTAACPRSSARLALAEGHPDRDQQVGVVVPPVPGGVPHLPAASPPSAGRRSPSSASTPATARDPAKQFLAQYPVPFPSYVDPTRRSRARSRRRRTTRSRSSSTRRARPVHPPGRLHLRAGRSPTDIDRYLGRMSTEVRVDPLTGLKVIIAPARAGPPRRRVRRSTRRPPIDPERDPFLPGHEDRTPPELHAVRAGGGGRTARLERPRRPEPATRPLAPGRRAAAARGRARPVRRAAAPPAPTR